MNGPTVVVRWLVRFCAVTMLLIPAFEASAKEPKAEATPACKPGPDQVAFFQDKNFMGACAVRGIGSYGDAAAMGIRNDQMSSVKVGGALQVVLCAGAAFSEDCQRMAADEPNLIRARIGNDRVSSAEVQARGQQDCMPGSRQVAVFAHREFVAPCEIREVGEYPDLAAVPKLKDSISSIRVGQDVQAVLCRRASFAGDCQLFAASDESLIDSRIGNDRATSLKVQPRGLRECVPKADEAALFKYREFLAPCVIKKIGDYSDAEAIGLSDNSISSMSIGPAVQVCACENEAFGGNCSPFVNEAPGVGSSIGIISSVKVQPAGAECKGRPAP
jgi:hypothetical protein